MKAEQRLSSEVAWSTGRVPEMGSATEEREVKEEG
jgi:hypothetical protein